MSLSLKGTNEIPSCHGGLENLDQGDLIHTTDFRQVYATLIRDWMGVREPSKILYGNYERLGFV